MVMANVEPTNEYDILAEHYDRAYNAKLGNRAEEIGILRYLVDVYQPDAQSLLDLGTGTGAVPRGFSGQIDDIVGIDTSPEMLKIARHEAPEATFIEADMSDFEVSRDFDVVTCLFNAINHLRGIDKWEQLFNRVNQHLSPGGIFIFDTVSIGLMRRLSSYEGADLWAMEGGSYEFDVSQIEDGSDDYRTAFTVNVEEEDGSERVITGNLYQFAYPLAQVEAVAAKHLQPLLAFDLVPRPLRDGRLKRVSDESIRPTFVYTKNEESVSEPTTAV